MCCSDDERGRERDAGAGVARRAHLSDEDDRNVGTGRWSAADDRAGVRHEGEREDRRQNEYVEPQGRHAHTVPLVGGSGNNPIG